MFNIYLSYFIPAEQLKLIILVLVKKDYGHYD